MKCGGGGGLMYSGLMRKHSWANQNMLLRYKNDEFYFGWRAKKVALNLHSCQNLAFEDK